MPNIGDIRHSFDLGYKERCNYMWLACANCGEERWVRQTNVNKLNHYNICHHCSIRTTQAKVAESKRAKGYVFKHARELGQKSKCLLYLDTCSGCGRQLWRQKYSLGRLCSVCAHKEQGQKIRAEKNGNWKGGRSVQRGYVWVTLSPDNPYILMARKSDHCNSYIIQEHRLIIARHLGRLLKSWEIVHHINGVKSDNRIENLELLPKARDHSAYTRMEVCIKQLEARVTLLEAENELLKSQYPVQVV